MPFRYSEAKLTSKGQVTIPKTVRDRLGLAVGDRIRFRFLADGTLTIEPRREGALGRLPGMLRQYAKAEPVSIEEMDEAIRAGAVERAEGRSPSEDES